MHFEPEQPAGDSCRGMVQDEGTSRPGSSGRRGGARQGGASQMAAPPPAARSFYRSLLAPRAWLRTKCLCRARLARHLASGSQTPISLSKNLKSSTGEWRPEQQQARREAQRAAAQAAPTYHLKDGELKAGAGVQRGTWALGRRGAGRDLTVSWRHRWRKTEMERQKGRDKDRETEKDREMETDRETRDRLSRALTLSRWPHSGFHETPSSINWSPKGRLTKLS